MHLKIIDKNIRIYKNVLKLFSFDTNTQNCVQTNNNINNVVKNAMEYQKYGNYRNKINQITILNDP